MSPTERTTIPCPQCQQPVEVEIWQVLDFGHQPGLRWRFLQGQLNFLRCANCGATATLAVPLVVHDPANEQVIFFIPDDPQITPEIFQQIQRQLGHLLMESLLGHPPDYIFRPTLCRDLDELGKLLAAGPGQAAEVSAQRTAEVSDNLPPEVARLLAALTPDQRQTFLSFLQNAADEVSFNRELAKHPDLLAALRQAVPPTIEAFPTELQAILLELSQPAQMSDMPRRMELCQQALDLVQREQQPELWAALQVELGNSLGQNPLGSWAESLEQAIFHFQQALEVRTRQAFPVDWAMTQNNLATAYADRIKGERGENLEQAIFHFQQALEVYTRQAFPADWAMTQNNLGEAYRDRIKGEPAENLEQAIVHYQQALEVYTRQAFPEQWAATQNNLATAYTNRIRGERVENIEQAIAIYQLALAVLTREAMPVEWAQTMMNLANAYYFRLRGDRAENLEQAIAAHQQALTIRTREAMPVKWAETMMNLATTYAGRQRGDRAESLEQAIAAYQQALTVRTREAMPVEWAQTMMNLANAYYFRLRGDRAENLEQAIAAYQQALTVLTNEARPVEWAQTMMNLANAYYFRLRGDRAENLEQAIAAHQQVLTVLTREGMPVKWAETMMNLANVYEDRLRGDRAENLEQAIAAYQQALTVRTREAMPAEWVQTMMDLANAYYSRLRGDRAENLEQAIAAYQQALTVRTREAMPVEWTTTMVNLAKMYYFRLRGDRAENLEQAIVTYKQALTILTQEAWPVEWAQTMIDLGLAYYSRLRGERPENLEQAIAAYQQALTVLTRETMPVDWATTMMNLALAYHFRLRGDWVENLEQAIATYQQALTVLTREAMPVEWAQTMMNLANAYYARQHGDRAENLEQAIAAYEQTLTVRTREAMPAEWALTMMNLANVYKDRLRGDREENLEQAIAAYQQALTIRTREAMPVEWAQTTMNSAIAYYFRLRGDWVENLEQAIATYQQALTVLTREAMPVEWAQTMMNLANAYYARQHGDRAENLEQAIATYQQALEVQKPELLPRNHRQTQYNLGSLYFTEQRWDQAKQAYTAAIAVSQGMLAGTYTEMGRRTEVAETTQLYARTAYCHSKLGQLVDALLILEQGKTRLLAESMALSEVNLSMLPEEKQLTMLTTSEAIRTLEAEMRLPPDTPARRSDRELAEALRQARADLNQLIETVRQEDYSDFMLRGLSLPEILALIPAGGALIAPLITSQGSAVFVIPHGVETVEAEHVLWLDEFKDDDFQALLVGTESEPGWLPVYLNFHHNLPAWFETIAATSQNLWTQLVGPIYDKLITLGVKPGASLLLMPQGGLGLLPLHAAWREVNGQKRTFLDDYTVTYTPSGYALSVSQRRLREEQRQQRSLLAVVNPTQNLTYTPIEGEAIAALFPPAQVTLLAEAQATPEAVVAAVGGRQSAVNFLHFSCHGFYNWRETMRSGLVLAGGQPLTLADIIAKLDLSAARLVTLSACETGLTEFQQSPDEYLGLPAGFLQAGAPGVVSTLWAVDDLSTMLLMERFYQHHLRDGMEIAAALRQAQLWLRDVTATELSQRFSTERQALLSSTRMPAEVVTQGYRRFAAMDPNERPFAHPFYWAAFTFSGA